MVLNFLNICQVHSVEYVSKSNSVLSVIFHAIYGAICIQLTHLVYLFWLWEYMNFILLSSSNRKYDPFAIV